MSKIFSSLILMIVITSNIAIAQENKDELKTRLLNLREKKAAMQADYERREHNIIQVAEERMAKIKQDYRKAHNECLDGKRKDLDEARRNYEAELKPMLKEEQILVDLVGRDAKEDFVKPYSGRSR